MRGNTIEMRLEKGRVGWADSLYQYDYGQRLILTGVELPVSYEVHFSNQENGQSKTMIGDSTGVDIPDEYLLTGKSIHVWVLLFNEGRSPKIYEPSTKEREVIPYGREVFSPQNQKAGRCIQQRHRSA